MRIRPHEHAIGIVYGGAPIGGLGVGGHRPSWSRWEDTDFTTPSSPVEQVELLGRSCFTVELAPPSHKPFPLRITVDAETGLVLRAENAGFGMVTEWVEVEIGIDVPDGTFAWTGPAEPLPTRVDRMRDHETDLARRKEWMDAHGVGDLMVPAGTQVMLHNWDEATGARASIEASQSGTLIRRPVSDQPWDEPDTTDYDHSYRWADPSWDWFLATESALSNDQLDELEAHLQATT